MSGRRAQIVTIFCVTLAIRIATIEATGAERVSFGDAADYQSAARMVCREHEYPDRGSLPFFRAPLLPAFIAAVTLCDVEAIRRVKYGLAVCDSATVVFISLLAELLWRRRVAAWLAGAIGSVHPVFIAGTCDIRSEPLFTLLLTASIYFLFTARGKRGGTTAVLSGFLLGLAALTRPTALACVPLFGLWFAFRKSPHADRVEPASEPTGRQRVRLAVLILFGAAAAVFPWTVRNYIRYHELIVVNDAGGYNFWRGTTLAMNRISSLETTTGLNRESVEFETRVTQALSQAVDRRALTPSSRSREWFLLGLKEARSNSSAYFRYSLRKAARYWRPWLDPREYPPSIVWLSALFFSGLDALALAGMVFLRRSDRPLLMWILMLFALTWIVHIPYQVVTRFRIPFTDPLLIALASGALLRIHGLLERPTRA